MLLGPKTVAFRKSAVREMTMAPKNRIKWQIATEKRKTQESPPWLFFALLIFSPVFNSCFVSDSEQLPLHRTIFFRQKLRKSSLSDNLPDFLQKFFFDIWNFNVFGWSVPTSSNNCFSLIWLDRTQSVWFAAHNGCAVDSFEQNWIEKKSLEAGFFWKIWKDCCLITSMMDRCASDR